MPAVAWNWFSIPALVALLVAIPMAAFVYFSAPHRAQNRWLGLTLFFEGMTWGSGGGLLYLMTERGPAFGAQALFVTGALALPFTYLLLVSTLQTPLVRWLQPRTSKAILLALLLASEAYWLTHPEQFSVEMVPTWYAPQEAITGPGIAFWFPIIGVMSLFGLVASLSAYRRAAIGSPARRKAAFFAAAFGTRDAFTVFITLVFPVWVPLPPSGTWGDAVYIWGTAVVTIAYVALLAYGILKTQLFDIDLRIKVGLSRGTVVAVFLAVFVVVAQIAQELLSDTLGLVVGGIAAALLLFAAAPLQRAAHRLADRAMPGVTASPDYLSYRKLHVYRAAVEAAQADGVITHRERTVLDTLRHELSIRDEDAVQIESDVGRVGARPT